MNRSKSIFYGLAAAVILTWSYPAVAAYEILIGFSGPADEYGRDILNGIEMAVNDLNAAGTVTDIYQPPSRATFNRNGRSPNRNPQCNVVHPGD